MNIQLTETLNTVDTICNHAFSNYFNLAAAIRSDASNKFYSQKKWIKRLAIVGGFISFFLLFVLLESLFNISGVLETYILLAIGIFIGIAIRKYLENKAKEKYSSEMNRADNIDSQGVDYMNAHMAELSAVPDDYWYPLATGYLAKVASNGRAENINQALSMLDEQLHRWKLEDSYSKILAEQQVQTASLRSIAISNAIIAVTNS